MSIDPTPRTKKS